MTTATPEIIAAKVKELGPVEQERVLRFIESLEPVQPLKSAWGLIPGEDISPEEIDELRREMWRSFPRDDFQE